jgi:hypothetical protein
VTRARVRVGFAVTLALGAISPRALSANAGASGCGPNAFLRGDTDCSLTRELSDAIALLDHLFRGGADLPCPDAADADDSGDLSITDAVVLLRYLFLGGTLPFPTACFGPDPAADTLGCLTGSPPCPRLRRVEPAGRVEDPRISQPSGIAASRRHARVFWVVNDFDAGRDTTLYAIGADGSLAGTLRLCEAPEDDPGSCGPDPDAACTPEQLYCDWEGLATGPGPDGRPYVFVGDIGANRFLGRAVFWIHRVPEPERLDTASPITLVRSRGDFDTVFFTYPPGGSFFDAEGLVCDSASGVLYIVTQETERRLYRLPDPVAPGETAVLEPIGDLPLGAVGALSAADISPDGEKLLLKSRADVYLLPWRSEDPLAAIAEGAVCHWHLPEFLGFFEGADGFAPYHAGALVFDSDSSFLSLEEYSRSHIFRVSF